MALPINYKLSQLINEKAISMHVPGHKNMTIGTLHELDFKFDMTEITGLDDLHHPEDIILNSQHNMSKHEDYDAFILVNGTTSGILATIQGFSAVDGRYLIARNVHKSVFHGLDLTHQSADILPMQESLQTHHYYGPQTRDFDSEQYKLAVVTYPNYYGECFDINSCISKLHAANIPVLVDEAHGAHFDLDGFPTSALNMKADYVVQSYHKTLPALTMGSILFIHKQAPQRDKVIQYLSYFQTSSPSYLVLASLEQANQFYQQYDSRLFFKRRQQFIEMMQDKGFIMIQMADPLKLTVQHKHMLGYQIQDWFEKMSVFVELADDYQVLLILPLWHEQDKYPFDELIERIRMQPVEDLINHNQQSSYTRLPCAAGSYETMDITHVTWVGLDNAQGMILAQHITPYPPGIPLFFTGERITQNMLKLIAHYIDSGVRVEGINNKKILVKDE